MTPGKGKRDKTMKPSPQMQQRHWESQIGVGLWGVMWEGCGTQEWQECGCASVQDVFVEKPQRKGETP